MAKKEGKYKGRAPTAQAKAAKVFSMHAKGVAKQDIAAACDIGIASVYRILKTAAGPSRQMMGATGRGTSAS